MELKKESSEPFTLSSEISLLELERSYNELVKFCYDDDANTNKLKIIKAFDCSYELVLKVLKQELVKYGIYVYSQVDIFRESVANGIILNSGRWLLYLERRDLINSTYDLVVVEKVLKIIPMFRYDLSELIGFLKSRK
jgi:hypothetical protein